MDYTVNFTMKDILELSLKSENLLLFVASYSSITLTMKYDET